MTPAGKVQSQLAQHPTAVPSIIADMQLFNWTKHLLFVQHNAYQIACVTYLFPVLSPKMSHESHLAPYLVNYIDCLISQSYIVNRGIADAASSCMRAPKMSTLC